MFLCNKRWLPLVALCLALCLTLGLSTPSNAADEISSLKSRVYVETGVGWDYANSIHLDSSDARIDFDSGVYDFSAALGARLTDRWRVELGYQKTRNTPEILFGSEAELELDSDELDFLKTDSLSVSLVRDLKIGRALRPYVGAGVGVMDVDLHFSEASVNGLFVQRPRRDVVNDSDRAFAYQVFAGITVPVTPWLDLAADYRFQSAPSVALTEVSGAPLKTSVGIQSAWLRARVHAPRRTERIRRDPGFRRGAYYAIRGGGGFAEDMGIENELTIDAFDPGPTFAVAVGYQPFEHWRIELEAAYRRNKVEVIELGPDIGEDAASGDSRTYSLMANAYYVFNPSAVIRPIVGVGGGLMRASFDIDVFGFCANLVCGPERRELFVDASDNAAALQVMAGVEIDVLPKLTFTADYRYLNSARLSVSRPNGEVFRGNMRTTSVVVGLRWSL